MSDDAAPIQMSELDCDAMVFQDLCESIKARRVQWPDVTGMHMSPANMKTDYSVTIQWLVL